MNEKKLKHLGISGGGTKIGALYAAARIIIEEKGYEPDIISGISAGALLSVPLALKKYSKINELVSDIKMEYFFSENPLTPDGKPDPWNAGAKLMQRLHYLGQQDNLEKTLKSVVSEEDFRTYQNGEYPICIVGAVDFYTGARVYVNLKDKRVKYKDFPKFVNGSGSIPVYTAGIEIEKKFWTIDKIKYEKAFLFDGGVLDHSPTAEVLRVFGDKILHTCTIFSRPKKYQNAIKDPRFKPKNYVETLDRYLDISLVEISKNDEYMEEKIAEEKGITYQKSIFLPWIMKHIYDINPKRLSRLRTKAEELAQAWSWQENLPA
jgi:predicted acylesterase/phospholipase RssA